MLDGASISAEVASGNVTEQVSHAALVCVMARDILSPLQPQTRSRKTNSNTDSSPQPCCGSLQMIFSVTVNPSHTFKSVFVYIFIHGGGKEALLSQGLSSELGFCGELNCPVK